MKKILLLLFLSLVGCGSLDLTVVHINDHHSHLEPEKVDFVIDGTKTKVDVGGYPEVVSVIKDIKKNNKNVLTLHAGDAITGTLYFTLFQGSADAKMMNLTGFDYFTLGNQRI